MLSIRKNNPHYSFRIPRVPRGRGGVHLIVLFALLHGGGCVIEQRPPRADRPRLADDVAPVPVDASQFAMGLPPASPQTEPAVSSPAPTPPPAIATALPPSPEPTSPPPPMREFSARVIWVNSEMNIAVLEGGGRFPAGITAVALRNGEPVGQLRISGPRKGNRLTADVLTGDVRAGDELRL